jgi:hypothetical protein
MIKLNIGRALINRKFNLINNIEIFLYDQQIPSNNRNKEKSET